MSQAYPKPRLSAATTFEVPAAANDNTALGFRVPKAANDNFKSPWVRDAERIAASKIPRELMRVFARQLGWVRLAETAYNIINTPQADWGTKPGPGWAKTGVCINAGPPTLAVHTTNQYCGPRAETAFITAPFYNVGQWVLPIFTWSPTEGPNANRYLYTWWKAGTLAGGPGVWEGPLIKNRKYDPIFRPAELPEALPIGSPAPVELTPTPLKWARRPWSRPDVRGDHPPSPFPRVEPRPKPEPVRPQPPGPHVKERKAMVAIGPGLVSTGLNFVTESFDAIREVYKALPAKYRPKRFTSPLEKALLIYRYWDKIDLGKALLNLLSNEAEDRFYGSLGRLAARANRRRGTPGGLQLGPALEGMRSPSWKP